MIDYPCAADEHFTSVKGDGYLPVDKEVTPLAAAAEAAGAAEAALAPLLVRLPTVRTVALAALASVKSSSLSYQVGGTKKTRWT
jgi:hypothetical protein